MVFRNTLTAVGTFIFSVLLFQRFYFCRRLQNACALIVWRHIGKQKRPALWQTWQRHMLERVYNVSDVSMVVMLFSGISRPPDLKTSRNYWRCPKRISHIEHSCVKKKLQGPFKAMKDETHKNKDFFFSLCNYNRPGTPPNLQFRSRLLPYLKPFRRPFPKLAVPSFSIRLNLFPLQSSFDYLSIFYSLLLLWRLSSLLYFRTSQGPRKRFPAWPKIAFSRLQRPHMFAAYGFSLLGIWAFACATPSSEAEPSLTRAACFSSSTQSSISSSSVSRAIKTISSVLR